MLAGYLKPDAPREGGPQSRPSRYQIKQVLEQCLPEIGSLYSLCQACEFLCPRGYGYWTAPPQRDFWDRTLCEIRPGSSA